MAGLVLLVLVGLPGCTSRKAANRQAAVAYQMGLSGAQIRAQQAEDRQRRQVIALTGTVRLTEIPWFEGMGVAEALLQAEYTGLTNPFRVLIYRAEKVEVLSVKALLAGEDIFLQPGDLLQVEASAL